MTNNSEASYIDYWKEYRSLIVFIVLMLFFRSAIADWNDVPTGSMQPTIVEGDRILVNKMAYDIRVPFTQHSLLKIADPQVNDIVIFESEVADKRLVKRVMAVPGDVISMHNNKLQINGQSLTYRVLQQSPQQTVFNEKYKQLSHQIRLSHHSSSLAHFAAVVVPVDHYLVLGDNRNNSADSRVIGFVPRSEIIGRSSTVVISLDYDNYFLPRGDRFLLDI